MVSESFNSRLSSCLLDIEGEDSTGGTDQFSQPYGIMTAATRSIDRYITVANMLRKHTMSDVQSSVG